MVKKINFKIDSRGEVSLDVSGFDGPGCEEFTRAFEEVLGRVSHREHKDTYYQDSTESETIEVGS